MSGEGSNPNCPRRVTHSRRSYCLYLCILRLLLGPAAPRDTAEVGGAFRSWRFTEGFDTLDLKEAKALLDDNVALCNLLGSQTYC